MLKTPNCQNNPSGSLISKLQKIIHCTSPFFIVLLISGCATETFFHANFNGNAINQPPLQAQEVGSVLPDGPPNSVIVVNLAPDLPGNWVKVSRPNNPSVVAGLQGTLKKFGGDGVYVFTTTLLIPSGSGVVTIQFERFNQPVNQYERFLHIDFLENNQVRIDDDANTNFGTFPRDKPFIAQVTLNIKTSASDADIVLSGTGASGQANRLIGSNSFARQFGAVRLWMGFPWVGSFNATNIVVKRRD
ncbi:MAG: hypothetical protein DHS20C18_45020 [Saprospiraceae bacterium]|nr:MAG: hypothetical protein DHS20C18_45020 [Saprospiraceae bacterium]